MKKSLTFIAGVAALCCSGSASALNANALKGCPIRSPGLGSLGAAKQITALGSMGPYCSYRLDWVSAFNPNDVRQCLLQEFKTSFTPSCNDNATKNITTVVEAGMPVLTQCRGFNLLGAHVDVSIIAGENAQSSCGNVLSGVAIIDGSYTLSFAM